MKQIQPLIIPVALTVGGAIALIYVISQFSKVDDESDKSALFGMLIIVTGMICVSGIVALDSQRTTPKDIAI